MNETQIQDINPNAAEIANLEAQIANIDISKLDPNDNGRILQPIEQKPVETTVETKQETTEAPAVDPIKDELERVKGQTQGKTPQEKAIYSLKLQAKRLEEQGINPAEILGIKQEAEPVEEKPLTRKDLEEIVRRSQPSPKTAIEMALEIENEAERELHMIYLENKINPNLSEEEKFQTAKEMVNGVKLRNQVTLNTMRPQTQTHSSASSYQPVKEQNFDQIKLTPQEEMFWRDAQVRGIPLSKEEIIKMRG